MICVFFNVFEILVILPGHNTFTKMYGTYTALLKMPRFFSWTIDPLNFFLTFFMNH